jgi:hypothetical protein
MFDLACLAAFAVAAFLVAWIVNGLVGVLSGEKPRDTASLWGDIFSRLFMVLELGAIGRVLNYCGISGRPRKFVFFVGLLCVLLFLMRARRHTHSDHTHTYWYTNTYPTQSQ